MSCHLLSNAQQREREAATTPHQNHFVPVLLIWPSLDVCRMSHSIRLDLSELSGTAATVGGGGDVKAGTGGWGWWWRDGWREEEKHLTDEEIVPLRLVCSGTISLLRELSFHFRIRRRFTRSLVTQLSFILPTRHYSVDIF